MYKQLLSILFNPAKESVVLVYFLFLFSFAGICKNLSADKTIEENPVQQNKALQTYFQEYNASHDISFLEKAFSMIERRKHYLLQEMIRGIDQDIFTGIPDTIIQQEIKLQDEIEKLEKHAKTLGNQGSSYKIEHEISKCRVKFESLKRLIKEYHPDYYALKYDQELNSLHDIRRHLEMDEAMLWYAVGEEFVFLICATRDTVGAFQLGRKQWISMLVGQLYQHIVNYRPEQYRVDAAIDFNKWCYPLYQQLINPAKTLINNKKLLIIPDNFLTRLPFGVLVENSAELDFRKMHYLQNNHLIRYSYSASLWVKSKQLNPGFVKGNLISFISDTEADMKSQYGTTATFTGRIHDIARGRYFKGIHSNKVKFTKMSVDYKTVHLAVPFYCNNQMPLQSAFHFKEQEDEIMHLTHLLNMNLNARLIMLTECRMNQENENPAPCLLSLNQLMIASGIPAFIFNLWKSPQFSLLKHFNSGLQKGYAKDHALIRAKKKYFENSDENMSHPAFWAGFILAGDPRAIDQPRRPWYLYLFIAFPVFMVLLLLYLSRHQISFSKS